MIITKQKFTKMCFALINQTAVACGKNLNFTQKNKIYEKVRNSINGGFTTRKEIKER